MKPAKPRAPARGPRGAEPASRQRVLNAAFAVFRQHGYAGASTLDIATRARVSKRDVYALFASKHDMLVACIEARAERMRLPLDPAAPVPETREGVAATLRAVGAGILRGLCSPEVIAVYRLAIAEASHAPEIARALDAAGRQANHQALAGWLERVQAQGLVAAGDPAAMVERFIALLWGDVLTRLLLRVRVTPTSDEIDQRAQAATEALMESHRVSKAADRPRAHAFTRRR
jgi:AcrR family transcriptional regulator